MANSDASFGLRPVMHKGGAPYNGACNAYYVGSSDGTALFIGDPVTGVGRANDEAISGNPPGSLPAVIRASKGPAAGPIIGVVVGVEPVTAESLAHRAASTQRLLWVCDDVDVLYEVQATGTLTGEMIGNNAQMIFTDSGSTFYNRSGLELDTGNVVTSTAGELKIHRMVPKANSDLSLANSVALVSINNHELSEGQTGQA